MRAIDTSCNPWIHHCLAPQTLNVQQWSHHLRLIKHPKSSTLMNIIINGLNIGYSEDTTTNQLRNSPNLVGARPGHPNHDPNVSIKILEDMKKEVELGRRAGPFLLPPFHNLQCSPIGAIPKKHSSKLRLIHHLSWPRDASGTSINELVADIQCEYLDSPKYGTLSHSWDQAHSWLSSTSKMHSASFVSERKINDSWACPSWDGISTNDVSHLV